MSDKEQECHTKNTAITNKLIVVIAYLLTVDQKMEVLLLSVDYWEFDFWYILATLFSFSCLFYLTAPPSIVGNHGKPENISVVEKNSVSLTCEASGIPLPAITWLKDGWPVSLSSSVRILSGMRNVRSLIIRLASYGHSFSLISPSFIFSFWSNSLLYCWSY